LVILPGGKPVVGKELVDLLGGVPHDAPQHVFQVFLRIDAQIAAGLDRERMVALALPPSSLPTDSQFFRPMVNRALAMLDFGSSPPPRKRSLIMLVSSSRIGFSIGPSAQQNENGIRFRPDAFFISVV
jgi:hypothetical protein